MVITQTLRRAALAGVAALSLGAAVVGTTEPASAHWHGGGGGHWHGGGWHGGWHGGGWHGGWHHGYGWGGGYGYGYGWGGCGAHRAWVPGPWGWHWAWVSNC